MNEETTIFLLLPFCLLAGVLLNQAVYQLVDHFRRIQHERQKKIKSLKDVLPYKDED